MRRLMILVVGLLVFTTAYAQATSNELTNRVVSGTINKNTSATHQDVVVYKLFPTENMWTFIKLNTRNGKIWQVQYDVEDNNRFETYLNLLPLITKDKEMNGRFTLHSTQNIYTFILLDQIDGRTWQVQWSIEPENRLVVPIK